jgi:hypothetical protein
MDQVITNIQDEPIMFIEFVILIMEPITIAKKSFQLVQLVVEPIQMENPQFFRFQHVPVPGHST